MIPNTSYEFRLWANNILGSGEAVITAATTLSQLSDESTINSVIISFRHKIIQTIYRRDGYHFERRKRFRSEGVVVCRYHKRERDSCVRPNDVCTVTPRSLSRHGGKETER